MSSESWARFDRPLEAHHLIGGGEGFALVDRPLLEQALHLLGSLLQGELRVEELLLGLHHLGADCLALRVVEPQLLGVPEQGLGRSSSWARSCRVIGSVAPASELLRSRGRSVFWVARRAAYMTAPSRHDGVSSQNSQSVPTTTRKTQGHKTRK
jgi:hypothetical protein